MVVSRNWLAIVDKLFLNQRNLPLVCFFQKLNAQISWVWLKKNAIMLAIIMRKELENIITYSSLNSYLSDEGSFMAMTMMMNTRICAIKALYIRCVAGFFPNTSSIASVIRKVRGYAKIPIDTLMPSRVVIFTPSKFAAMSDATNIAERRESF